MDWGKGLGQHAQSQGQSPASEIQGQSGRKINLAHDAPGPVAFPQEHSRTHTAGCHGPVILAFRRLKQEDGSKLEAILTVFF